MVMNIISYLHFFKFSERNPTYMKSFYTAMREYIISYSLNILYEIVFISLYYIPENFDLARRLKGKVTYFKYISSLPEIRL